MTWEAIGVETDRLFAVCTEATTTFLCRVGSSGFFTDISILEHSFIPSPGDNDDDGVHMRSDVVRLLPSPSFQRLLEHSSTALAEPVKPLSRQASAQLCRKPSDSVGAGRALCDWNR